MAQGREGFADDFNFENESVGANLENGSVGATELEAHRPDVEDIPAYYKRRSAGFWACLASLTVVLAVAVAYGYAVLQHEDIQVAQVPGIAKSLSAIGLHVADVERRLADSKTDQHNLAARIQNIAAESAAGLDLNRQQTAAVVAQVQQTLLAHVNQQTAALQPQLSQLLRERDADRARVAQLEQQLTQARYDLASTRQDYTRQAEAVRAVQDEIHREIASINNSLFTPAINADMRANEKMRAVPEGSSQLMTIQETRQPFNVSVESVAGDN